MQVGSRDQVRIVIANGLGKQGRDLGQVIDIGLLRQPLAMLRRMRASGEICGTGHEGEVPGAHRMG